MLLRQATISDLCAIENCIKAAYFPYIQRMQQKPAPLLCDYAKIIKLGETFVLGQLDLALCKTDPHKVIGVLVIQTSSECYLIENVAVHPGAQGQGLGRKILEWAEQRALKLGYSVVELYTNKLMHESLKLYKKTGYTVIKTITEDGFERVYLQKKIVGS
jgi:GNAT superfamily N-acetyltransferase